jgi:hypothetical protein
MKLSERNQLLSGSLAQQLFALVNLGLVQSMASGVPTPTEAVEHFYRARNCLYVQKTFQEKRSPNHNESRSTVT